MHNWITHSQRTMAKTCLRKHWFRYVAGIRRTDDGRALSIGRAVHAGLEHGNVYAAIEAYDAKAPYEPTLEWWIDREVVAQMLAARTDIWAHDPIDVIAPELTFDLPIVNPQTGRPSTKYRKAGKIDGIVRLADGRLAIIEYKTTSNDIAPESDYWKRLRIDSQISTYIDAARQFGYPVETIVYDVMRKPAIKPSLLTQGDTAAFVGTMQYYGQRFDVSIGDGGAVLVDGIEAELKPGKQGYAIRETIPMFGARLARELRSDWRRYYARREIGRTDQDIKEAQWDEWHTMKILNDCANHDRWPRNTSQCIGFGRCPYFDLCTNSFDPAQPLPDGYEYAEPHEELQEDV